MNEHLDPVTRRYDEGEDMRAQLVDINRRHAMRFHDE